MATVFLAWQSPTQTRAWYPIGRLDADPAEGVYRFRYVRGAQRAKERDNLQPLLSFPDLTKQYESKELFPLFRNRILSRRRTAEFQEYLAALDIGQGEPDPLAILAISEGRRQTDTLEVFPKLSVNADGAFQCRFFVHGSRHVTDTAQARMGRLESGEELRVAIEMNNPATGLALQVQTSDYHMIGWSPRYLVADLVRAIGHDFRGVSARVVKANPGRAISRYGLMVELLGTWPKGVLPMSTDDFSELVHC